MNQNPHPEALEAVTRLQSLILLGAVLSVGLSGCTRETPLEFASSEQVLSLTDPNDPENAEAAKKLQDDLRAALADYAGTHAEPKLISDAYVTSETLKLGQQVYDTNCLQCHGVSGDGNGPAAKYMYPRPRDYRKGLFKFTSTPYGYRPHRSDLMRTLRKGIQGTSMPSFKLLPDEELEAVVDYVMALGQRGELESQLVEMVEFEEAVDPELIPEDYLPNVVNKWNDAQGSQVSPLSPQPVFTLEHVKRGEEAFLSKELGCFKCHGPDGRGQTPDNLAGNLKDNWGNATRAADLTSGILHGGQEPIDLYRRIYSGINGTPMPGFANALQSEPDKLWDLVAYVMHITNARRRINQLNEFKTKDEEVIAAPLPGPLKPYIPEEAPEAAAESDEPDDA
ncbi:MAG: c-type cytochrome [Planctomycetaceae bacterium]